MKPFFEPLGGLICRPQPVFEMATNEGFEDVGVCSMDWFSWENLNRKPWLLPSNIGVSFKFSHHPIP
jgi:hypothetical protein